MKAVLRSAAALMSGAAAIAPLAGQAQPVPSQPPAAPAQPPPEPAEAPPPTQFLDTDGNPLPPDVQRELEEQLRERSPPAPNSENGRTTEPLPTAPARAGDGEMLVTGQRPRGSVVGDTAPERTFSPLDIGAYGAGNVAELIQALGPQVTSNRGGTESRPVTLLNGRRVSSFTEIAEIPAEAIERMEVFPEELALRYGYRADQKVVNIVTFERFRSQHGQVGYIMPTDGGHGTASLQANYFAIRRDTRFDFGAAYSRSASLLESDRELAQPGGALDAGRFRTLLPATERLTFNGVVSGTVLDGVSSTLSGRVELNTLEGLLGRDANGLLAQQTDIWSSRLGTTSHGRMGNWLWTFAGNYDRLSTEVSTDVVGANGRRDQARSVYAYVNASLLLSGPVLRLPAGPVSASILGSAELRDFSGTMLRDGVERQVERSRDSGALQLNLDVPIARRRGRGIAWLGNLSANGFLEVEQLSDFGTLRTFGYGLNWSPVDAINIIASVAAEETAPLLEQLAAPLIVTPNVRTFDFTRREVADVTQLFGGNPTLRADDRRSYRFGVTARPLAATDLTLSIDYVATRIDDPIVPFPIVTPTIEAAFPERFTRGSDGRLLQIDGRSLNFEESRQERLRWGVNFVRPLGAVEPWMRSAPARTFSNEAEARAAVPRGTMVAMVQPNSAMARRFENMASRLYVSLYHTWRLRDEVVVRQDLPALDLLNGAALDLRGGRPRHEIELQAGVFKAGLGGRLTLNWQSGTTISNPGGAGDLTFSELAIVNLNMFMNLADRFGGADPPRWLRGARATLGVTNLFNARPEVRDQTGSTPLSYQPAYLDPLGRLLSLSVRMAF